MATTRLSSLSPVWATKAEPILRLYGRADCHLCEEMAGDLRALGVAFVEIDVDSDLDLAARYGRKVPVLTDGAGRQICHARLDGPALRARLALE
ncbi:MAG: glutaredoxin family protein [Burkholderiales bacterium]